ncbi:MULTISPECIES: hypothetical protein [Cupriavidus]|uniref:Uncharacterized protein n=2 Tax=Cupriavidus TaxID=106589 RepID=A0A375CPS8_9BURK|nr:MULTISPECIES: hypothetical protein [Cupriavidus]SOY75934.1 hypothetical protein CBM2585_P350005 [Cupriavidus taiwanensis]SOY75953.1 hypothetical protein CBM2588_P390005 [Cupriavidus taiwanensis]SOY76776.1 hypothetical protein CBM2589_P350008 [Cupriavidus taiwanensis]SOY78023.1 hypothetical protein CBM2586_P360006 [Cupriavidus taiwanensis]SOZ00563.1 hypothetical protein CBM2591_P380007 [Cupriavidus taiwanensis]
MTAHSTQGFNLDNSGRRVVVDPVTRIEGHMRCEVNLDANLSAAKYSPCSPASLTRRLTLNS